MNVKDQREFDLWLASNLPMDCLRAHIALAAFKEHATLLARVKQLEEALEWVLSQRVPFYDMDELRRRVPLISP